MGISSAKVGPRFPLQWKIITVPIWNLLLNGREQCSCNNPVENQRQFWITVAGDKMTLSNNYEYVNIAQMS